MKISKMIWVDSRVKWNRWTQRILCRKNYYKQHAYIVCTSPQEKLLFEIVETKWLSEYYSNETVVAICSTKNEAIKQITQLIDGLYNTKKILYSDLK